MTSQRAKEFNGAKSSFILVREVKVACISYKYLSHLRLIFLTLSSRRCFLIHCWSDQRASKRPTSLRDKVVYTRWVYQAKVANSSFREIPDRLARYEEYSFEWGVWRSLEESESHHIINELAGRPGTLWNLRRVFKAMSLHANHVTHFISQTCTSSFIRSSHNHCKNKYIMN